MDSRNYRGWLELLAEDIIYRMPARITNEGKHDTPNIDYKSRYFEETKKSLVTRVRRLDSTSSAWAEISGPRQRHFISNVFIESGKMNDGNEEYFVRSNFLFKRNRGSALLRRSYLEPVRILFEKRMVNGSLPHGLFILIRQY